MENRKALGTLSFSNFLKIASQRFPEKDAFAEAESGKRITFRELNRRVNCLANGLLELGLRKGDFISVLSLNSLEFVEIYFALAKAGCVLVPLGYRLSPPELNNLINFAEAKVLIYDYRLRDKVEEIKTNLNNVKYFICFGGEAKGNLYYEDIISRAKGTEPAVEVFEEDWQLLNFTSGTTGLPKGYILTHYNNVLVVGLQFNFYNLTEEDVIATVFPMYGRTGFAWVAASIMKGAKNVILNFDPDKFMRIINEERVTFVNLVPTMAQMLLHHPGFNENKFSSLRKVLYVGSPLSRVILEDTWKNICPNVYEMYGLQETSMITNIDPELKRRKPDSVGYPALGVEMRLVDEEGKDVAVGQTGEIICCAPTATTGYYKRDERTAEVVRGRWFHTGDLGKLDNEGDLYIIGRKKDMIISGGENIFAAEIEEVILGNEKVSECAVIGLPDKLWGELVTAVVVLREGEDLSEEELITYCKERIPHFKAPKRVRFASSIPRNPNGKIMKYILVEKFGGRD